MEEKIQKFKSRWNICYYLVRSNGERHIRKSLACARKLAEHSCFPEEKNQPEKDNA